MSKQHEKGNMNSNLISFAAALWIAVISATAQPIITSPPANQTSSLFADATFRVSATSTNLLYYQWQFNGAPVGGATGSSFTIANVQKTNAGPYAVIVTDPSGSVTSKVATLTITPFNSIYCFGFSWTDTHNYPWPAPEYWQGHPSNGPLWPELLSTNLGLAYAAPNNYAVSGALASEVLNQVVSFASPANPSLSLYFFWAGDCDFLHGWAPEGFKGSYVDPTNEPAWTRIVQGQISSNSNAVNRLYLRGARAIVVQNAFDWSRLPALISAQSTVNGPGGGFGTDPTRQAALRGYCEQFNAGLSAALDQILANRPDLRLISVDMFSRLNDLLAAPQAHGLTKATSDALDDPMLTDKSFAGAGGDYVFWDGVHPTSKVHELFAAWNLDSLTNSVLEKLAVTLVNDSLAIEMRHLQIGRDYALQQSTDLKTWGDLLSFTASAGTNQWSAPAGIESAAYFRLRWDIQMQNIDEPHSQ